MELSDRDKEMFRQIHRDVLKGPGAYCVGTRNIAKAVAKALAAGQPVSDGYGLGAPKDAVSVTPLRLTKAQEEYYKAWPTRAAATAPPVTSPHSSQSSPLSTSGVPCPSK